MKQILAGLNIFGPLNALKSPSCGCCESKPKYSVVIMVFIGSGNVERAKPFRPEGTEGMKRE